MITAAFVGCVAAYYFGLRAGAYAAAATFALTFVAFFFPSYETALHVCIAVALFAMWLVGSRRPVPPDSALAVRWVRGVIKRIVAFIRSR